MVILVSHLTLGRPMWLWPLTNRPKKVGFFYSIGAITLFTFKALGQVELKLLAIYGFYFSGPCDLDISPTDPQINRSLLLNKDIHYMKFEGSGWKRTPVIEWNVFIYGAPVTMTFDLLSPKSIGFFTQDGLSSYEVSRLWDNGHWSYWAETFITLRVTVTLTFDLLTPKSIEFL